MAIITINAWNRLSVAFRAPIGLHVPRASRALAAPAADAVSEGSAT
jgi:hypothetical protein